MTLAPSDLHETLDRRGLLAEAHGPGVYALEIQTPDTVEALARTWRESVDAALPEGYAERLVAEDVAYVGASMQVYDRLAEHARGDVRRATFLEAFDAVDIIDVWAHPEPFVRAERARGRELCTAGWVVWTDGVLL